MTDYKITSISLPQDLYFKLLELAAKDNTSVTKVVISLVEKGLDADKDFKDKLKVFLKPLLEEVG